MKKYSILIIGFYCYHGHIREFVTALKKKNPLVDISLALMPDPNINIVVDDFSPWVNRIILYKKKGASSLFGRFLKGLYYYRSFLAFCLKGGFDIVDIHFANRSTKHFMPLIKMMTNNIVITPWGSDVLRVVDEIRTKELRRIYSCANHVTVGKDTQIGACLISRFNVSPEKLVKLSWGGEFFDYIQENLENVSVEMAKERFGLKDRYVITCGYNTQKEQRHEEIINAINSVKDQLPDNLTLLFPFTYGRTKYSDQYIRAICDKCKELQLDYVSVIDHLDMADLLRLRMATDIFVHVQKTDAGSRCVSEYIICNKKVVHGSWMRYKYMEENKPTCYFPVDCMEQLSDCVVKAYRTQICDLPQAVKECLLKRSWNNQMTYWNAFFESLVYEGFSS